MRAKFSQILTGFLLLITFMTGCGTDPGKKTPEDQTGLTTPTNLTATAIGSGQIDLSWTASTDDKGVTGYYIYSIDIQVADVTTTTYSRSGLSPDTEYCHTVKAYDADGNVSNASKEVCAKTTQKVDVSELISAAKLALESQDIPAAKAKFEEAYAGDSTDKDANFGLAMTEGIMLIEDPDVINIIEKWGGYAPKVKNVVYGILGDTFEVYGGNNPYCGTEPVENGYTKLSTTDTSSPFTYNGSYSYYLIYVPGFSQIKVDAVGAAGYVNNEYCTSGRTDGYFLKNVGDGYTVTIGDNDFTDSALIIKANNGATDVTVTTTGNATAQKPLTLSKAISDNEDADPVNQFKELVGKLPKNRVSLLKKIRITVGRTIPSTAPTVSEMQTVIDNKILPVLDDMIKKVRTVEGTDYTFTITPAMTDYASSSNTDLDDGDFYALDAGLSGLKSILNIVTAYNLDVDYNIIEADPLSAINGHSVGLESDLDSTKFFTLKDNGNTKMTTALASLTDGVVSLKKSFDFVMESDPNNNTDNGINYMSMSIKERQNFKNWIKFGTNALNGPADFSLERGDDGISFTGDDEYLQLDLSKFFNTPIDRTDLPTFGYDLPLDGTLSQQYDSPVHKVVDEQVIDSEIWLTSDFPDRTFNGVFPNGLPDSDANLYLKKAILLPQEAWWGDDWNANIALDGDGNFTLRKEGWDYKTGDDKVKLFTINPSDGLLLGTTTGIMDYGPNKINNVNQRVWHENKMWASGTYYDASSDWNNGVFSINPADIGLTNIQIPLSDYGYYDISGIASDDTNLYVGIGMWECDWNDDMDCGNYTFTGGVVKFQTDVSEIPTSPLLIETDESPDYMTFGDGYLWVTTGNGVMKVDTAGKVIKRYDGPWDAPQMYYDEGLWSVQGKKLISLAP